MDTFSQRSGFKPKKDIMQIESMDADLRNTLWNVLTVSFWEKLQKYCGGYRIDYDRKEPSYTYSAEDLEINNIKSLIVVLWVSHFKKLLDDLSGSWRQDCGYIKQQFFQYTWYEVYDLLEFIAKNYTGESELGEFIRFCNHIFERELSGYRFIGSTITPITSEAEIKTIEDALAGESKLSLVSEHINTALAHLSSKENPDYRNSIKESISAVESICCLIADDSKATLGKALSVIGKEQKVELHPALNKAFSQLYGYTSDADGIRHSLLEESELDFEDAKFMLVSCSAFTNYLKGKAMKAGIDFNNW